MHAAPPPVEPYPDTIDRPRPDQPGQRAAKARLRVALIAVAAVTVVLLAWAWGVKQLSQRISADLDRTLQELPVASDSATAGVAD